MVIISVKMLRSILDLFASGDTPALQIFLCAGEVVVVTIDPRTGRLNLRDTGDLAAAGRGPRFAAVSEKINENPVIIVNAIISLRYNVCQMFRLDEQNTSNVLVLDHRGKCGTESCLLGSPDVQAAQYVPKRCARWWLHNLFTNVRLELEKFGQSARAHLFVQLRNFPTHYLVIVIADDGFKFALVSVKSVVENARTYMVMDDIGWLDVARIRGNEIRVQLSQFEDRSEVGMKRKAVGGDLMSRTNPTKPDTERLVQFHA
jgi:mediator of RNA polymerase II transcription subunit 14